MIALALCMRRFGGAALGWFLASPMRLAVVALAVAAMWLDHQRNAARADAAHGWAMFREQRRQFGIQTDNLARVRAALERQNAAVLSNARAANAAHAAQQAALTRADDAARRLDGWAARQRADAEHAAGPGCATPAAVMDQAKEGSL